MANRQTPPLTDQEIRSVYRNEFFGIDEDQYFEDPSIGIKVNDDLSLISDVENFAAAANEIPGDLEWINK